MPKIRGVKPELWTDENFVELSPYARLLWIGLWNHACDNGHLQDKSKQIKMRILPTDDVNCAELLREIEGQKLIERAGGWITIPNLSHHQKPHKRWWSTCDKPGCDLPEGASRAPSNRVATVATPKPNRGATADVDGDGEVELKVTTGSADSDVTFDDFWTIYPRKEGKGAARKAWAKAVKLIAVDDLLPIVRSFSVRVHGTEPRFIPFPATWLNQERWSDEVDEQQAEADGGGGWFQPFTMPPAPPEIEDDPEAYAEWAEGRRRAWQAGERW